MSKGKSKIVVLMIVVLAASPVLFETLLRWQDARSVAAWQARVREFFATSPRPPSAKAWLEAHDFSVVHWIAGEADSWLGSGSGSEVGDYLVVRECRVERPASFGREELILSLSFRYSSGGEPLGEVLKRDF